jgi:peptide/nickel transport system substrate-binding protein
MIIFFICWLLLTACAQPVDDTEIKFAIAEIRFAISQAPLNLDPRYATDAASERLNRLIYLPLIDFDAASKPAWILVSSHAFDGTQLTITLKDNLPTFHHGKKFSAADVKATYDSLLALKDSPHAAEFANIASIIVVDDKTIIFNLKTADKHFLEKLVIGILPADLIASNQDFSHNPVGNGALKFISWDNKIKLQRVKDGMKITLQEVKDPTVRVLKLLRNEVDLLQGDLPPELVKYLQSKPEIVVETGVGSNFSYLGLNFNDPILKNLKVRQAIAHAINRPDIIQKVMVKSTREADQILPPEHYTNASNTKFTSYDYNPELSKKLLLEAGVKLPLKLVYKTSTDAQRVRFATIMQAQMREAGIELEIKSLDWGTFFADVKAGNFQLFGLTWVGIKTPEIYSKTFGSQHFPPNGFNRGRYVDAELDKLLADENWQMATTRIHNELPYIPLWYEGHFVAMQKNISNYKLKPDGNWDDLATIQRYER